MQQPDHSVGRVDVMIVRTTALKSLTAGIIALSASIVGGIQLLTLEPMAPEVDIGEAVNPGVNSERELCLRVALGAAASAECGDLRISHALPTTTTFNKARTPILSYSSHQAHPYPLIRANVQLPPGAEQPDSVTVKLMMPDANGDIVAQETWDGAQWSPGETRRTVIGFDALEEGLATGLHPYTLRVTNHYGPVEEVTDKLEELAIVNRSDSFFGAGWWLLGLEQLLDVPGQPDKKLWIGGDGSTRVYTDQGGNVWETPNRSRPDTILFTGGEYRRGLPGSIKVVFDAGGKHLRTVPRIAEHTTSFEHVGEELRKVVLPVPTGAPKAREYQFSYPSGVLESVTAPDVTMDGAATARVTAFSPNASGQIDWIRDPGDSATETVDFSYDTEFSNRILSRTNRGIRSTGSETNFQRATTSYGFNRLHQVSSSHLDPGAPHDVINLQVDHGDLLSLDHVAAIPDDAARTVILGPRINIADNTTFALNGFGSPDTIINARDGVTSFKREHGTLPALITDVVDPLNRHTTAVYDARGNVTTITDLSRSFSGQFPVQSIEYTNNEFPDFPTRIVSPTQEQVIIEYQAGTGHRSSQRDGRPDAPGPGVDSKVMFQYYTSGNGIGLLQSSDGPISNPDLVTYDQFGNATSITTPGGIVTTLNRDEIGRLRETVSPIITNYNGGTQGFRRDSLYYDIKSRVAREVGVGPQTNFPFSGASDHVDPADILETATTYDPQGNPMLVTVMDRGFSDDATMRGFTYDLAGRVDIQPKGNDQEEVLTYDAAGNVKSLQTVFGATITMAYDELNRLTQRSIPGRSFSKETCIDVGEGPGFGLAFTELPANCNQIYTFPFYPNETGEGLRIRSDVQTFTYDAVGNIKTANNAFARITRNYYSNGTLANETLQIRDLHADDDPCAITNPEGAGCDTNFGSHSYTTAYEYDSGGRLVELDYPNQLLTATGDLPSATLTYDQGTFGSGLFNSITDPTGRTYIMEYDGENRLKTRTLPPSIVETLLYDAESRVRDRTISRIGVTLLDETLTYDPQGKVLTAASTFDNQTRNFRTGYSGLGVVMAHEELTNASAPQFQERFEVDATGNLRSKESTSPAAGSGEAIPVWQYLYQQSRLRYAVAPGPSPGTGSPGPYSKEMIQDFDEAGNVVASIHVEERTPDPNGAPAGETTQRRVSKSWYGYDGKLRFSQRYIAHVDIGETDGSFEEYWYDALGRRVQVRSRQDDSAICSLQTQGSGSDNSCMSYTERVVWSGDQVLGELRGPGATRTVANMPPPEPDQPPGPTPESILNREAESRGDGPDEQYGRIAYAYGTQLDAPLGIIRNGNPPIVPFATFKGGYFGGIDSNTGAAPVFAIDWPATRRKTFHDSDRLGRFDKDTWVGNVVMGFADQSGLLYRRNRYYDPLAGQFTQEDPIGLAGGSNLYGFAGGDPINRNDPFGLMANCCLQQRLNRAASSGFAVGSSIGGIAGITTASGCAVGTAGVCTLAAPVIVGGFAIVGGAGGALIGIGLEGAEELGRAVERSGRKFGRRVVDIVTGIVGLFGGSDVTPPDPPEPDPDQPKQEAPRGPLGPDPDVPEIIENPDRTFTIRPPGGS